ncbi:MAG: ParA family protein [Bacteroidota bacterium]
MPILTVVNHKGGTGKTTSVLHIAAAYGLSGQRVLLVDLDPQGFLTKTLGIPRPMPSDSSLALFDAAVTLRALGGIQRLKNFDLLPAATGMTRAQRGLNKPTDVFWIKEALQHGHPYDLIIFDTAAAVSVFSMNALVTSDHALIPVTPEYQPVVGAEQTFRTVQTVRQKLNPGLSDPFFLLTQVDARKRDHAAYTHYLRERYGERVLSAVIRTSAQLAEFAEGGATIFDRDITSRGALDYANAADELRQYVFEGASLGAPAPVAPVATPTPEENEAKAAASEVERLDEEIDAARSKWV